MKGTTEEIVWGLHLGADDYVVKPYAYRELSSRVMVGLRRRQTTDALPPVFRSSRDVMLVTDPDKRLLFINDREPQLIPTELEVLKYLLKNQGKVLSADAI